MPPVPQQVANLLNLPVAALRRLARDLGVELPSAPRELLKWDYVMALANVPQETLQELAGDWLYAGQTSLTWLVLGDGEAIDLEEVRAALVERYDVDVFEDDIRPSDVSDVPQLVDARPMGDGKVVFTFVVARRVTTVIHNFQPQPVYADEFFVAVLRLNEGVFEIRASHERARQLVNTWVGEFAEHLQ